MKNKLKDCFKKLKVHTRKSRREKRMKKKKKRSTIDHMRCLI